MWSVHARDLIVVRASAVEGVGVFARVPVPEQFVVGTVRGRLMDPAHTSATCVVWGADEAAVVEPEGTPDDNVVPLQYMNHSCVPNCRLEWKTDALTVRTNQAIAAGDELTFDYQWVADTVDELTPCQCGHVACRGYLEGTHTLHRLGVRSSVVWAWVDAGGTHGEE
jgi:uncharacterized protein